MSDFLEERFKKSFNLKIRFAEIRKGLKITNAVDPYAILGVLGLGAERNFCLVLYLNFLGCNIIYGSL